MAQEETWKIEASKKSHEKAARENLTDNLAKESQAVADSEKWNTPIPIRAPLLIEAFSFGVLSADFWFSNYKAPEGLELAINWIAFNIQRDFGEEPFITMTLNQFEEKLSDWMKDGPWIKQWNSNPKYNNTTRRVLLAAQYVRNGMPSERPFLDLHAIVRNAAIFVNDNWKRSQENYNRLSKINLPANSY